MNRLFEFLRGIVQSSYLGLNRVIGLIRNFDLLRKIGPVRVSGLVRSFGLVRAIGFSVCLIAFLILGIRFVFWFKPIDLPRVVDVRIPNGMALSQIAWTLESKGVIRNESDLVWPAKLLGLTKQLKAGHYRFEGRVGPRDVIQTLKAGRVVRIPLTIPEGTRMVEIASTLHAKLGLDSTAFVRRSTDAAFAHALGAAAGSLEGYLFPETYFVDEASGLDEIIRMVVGMFFERVTDSLVNRANAAGFTLHQAVTLASIVEGEAMLDSERPMIAALYLNRLRRGMPLQADPTIQYIIPDGPRRLLRKDLSIQSPYNTYLHAGLPPGPINNPGLASILAVLDPAHEPVLFMVANGDGSHTFSTNLKDHAAAKSRFDKIRRNVARQERLSRSKIEKSAQ